MNNLRSGIWCERDRQRERERQVRAQMLPSDDKDITANTQDLFESPPVKVDPVAEDQTTAEIKKQFGNFESVRPYILDNPRYSHRLIGVDQTAANRSSTSKPASNPQCLPHRPSAGNSAPANNSANNRPAPSGGANRNHVQQLPTASSEPSVAPAKNPPGIAGFKSTFVPVSVKPLDSGSSSHKSPQVPPQAQHHSASGPSSQPIEQANQSTKPQPKLNNTFKQPQSSSASGITNNSNNNNHQNSGSGPFRSGPAPFSAPPPSHSSRSASAFPPPTNPAVAGGVRKPTNLHHVSHSSSQGVPNSYSSNSAHSGSSRHSLSGGSIDGAHKAVLVTQKVEHLPPASHSVVVVKSEEVASSSNSNNNNTSANSARFSSSSSSYETSKTNRTDSGSDGVERKPVLDLEAVDSPVELDTILKEMMDVKTPVTGIQTPGPANDTSTQSSTKAPQRRSSKGEDTVQSINESGITNVPSPLKKMDSSGDSSTSSSGSDSDSDSDDSSSGSQGEDKDEQTTDKPTTNSPTRNWDLSSFLREKDTKTQESILDSTASPAPVSPLVQVKTESNVSSTSIYGKPVTPSPKEAISIAQSKSPRKVPEVKTEPYVPAKPPLSTAPTKGSATASTPVIKTKGASLSESSSEDESSTSNVKRLPKEVAVARVATPEPKRAAPVNKRQKSLSSSPERKPSVAARSVDSKNKAKKGQDRNKNDTIRKVFCIKGANKLSSPTPVETEKPTKTTASTTGKGKVPPAKGKGKPSPKAAPAPAVNNRVSAKDSGKKGAAKSAGPPAHNGTTDPITSKTGTSTAKRKEAPKKATPQPPPLKTAKTHHKSQASGGASNSLGGSSAMLPPLPPPAARVKDDVKPNLTLLSSSSLICRIPLHKLPKRARFSGPASQSSTNQLPIKAEKVEKGGVPNKDDISKHKLYSDFTRVGSSSDHPNEVDLFGLTLSRAARDSALANDKSKKPGKRSKRITSSQRKGKPEPASRIKVEEDCGMTEVSSNVPGYSPPVDMEIVQAPDSSLHPSSHLLSPIVASQPAYLSYFDKIEHPEDEDILDQDTYLETAKKLKHKADKEECGSFKQVFTYLESGLYFILTGIAIEKERPSPSKEAHTMYKDTLHLIRYIGNRFRSRPDCYAESKVMVLGLRCQALLSLKLFKMKFKEAKDIVEVLSNHFQKTPPTPLELANSPQLSTPSPRSPTSSPASSLLTGLNPSPHHPYQNHPHLILSQNLHAQMYKHCTHSMNLMNAHEFWEAGDTLVHKSHIEDFFIAIDRICGPLTLHSSLTDLVRYVKHGIKVLKDNAEIS